MAPAGGRRPAMSGTPQLPACPAPPEAHQASRPAAERGLHLPARIARRAGRRHSGLPQRHAGSCGPPAPPRGEGPPGASRCERRLLLPFAPSAAPPPQAPPFLLQLKMAAEVDFGDRELFEQLEEEDRPPPPPRLSCEEEEEGPDKALEELYARLRDREETVRRLRAENILTGEAGPAPGRAQRGGGKEGAAPAAGSLPGQPPWGWRPPPPGGASASPAFRGPPRGRAPGLCGERPCGSPPGSRGPEGRRGLSMAGRGQCPPGGSPPWAASGGGWFFLLSASVT